MSMRSVVCGVLVVAALNGCTCGGNPYEKYDAFAVSSAAGSTGEDGRQTSFTLSLNRQPTAPVTIQLASSNPAEGTVGSESLTFTPENWNARQRVTVTGVDDELADGNQAFRIELSAASSEDAFFAGLQPRHVNVVNVDDDSAGFLIGEASGNTTEAGAQATLTVALTSKPTAPVSVGVASGDPTEGTATPAELTFTPDNWNAPQTVLVTGVDDDEDDGEQSFAVTFAAASSEDADYEGLIPDAAVVKNTDNDTAGVTTGTPSGSTTEAGAQATVTVVLNARPTAPVTFSVSSSDPGEATLTVSNVTFTPDNWNAPKTLSLTGVDDDLADGEQPYELLFDAGVSEDVNYAGMSIPAIELTNVDNDSAGITVSSVTGAATEAGGQASFTVVLNSQPYGDVTVSFDTSAADEGTVAPKSLVFTDVNWNAPQTVLVTGVDDALADGNQPFSIDFAAPQSSDTAYAAMTPANVTLTNTDNDSAGFTVSAVSGPSTETGGQATFTLALTSEPYADVTVSFTSSDVSEGTVTASSVTFTAANWNAPQTIAVTGVDDALADGNQPYAITFGATTSADPAYAALTPANVNLANSDDDTANIVVSAISGDTSEANGQATFTVALTSEPYAAVTVSLDSNDATEGNVMPKTMIFDANNWSVAQTATVTGLDDNLADGNQPYAIVFGATTSADAAYAAITPSNVNVVNTDDDSAGIAVSPISGPTTEAGGQATFTVALSSEPFADVTVSFASNDATEGTVSPASLTFTAANWNVAQTATLTGVDDAVQDGQQPWSIVFGATTSADGAYAAITPANLSTTNTDDDSAGLVVSVISGDTTELGGTATFTVRLNSEPTADVTVGVSSTDTTEGTVSPASLTFTAGNWNALQTVTITGVDDAVYDPNVAYQAQVTVTTSNDPIYAAAPLQTVSVVNADNESPQCQRFGWKYGNDATWGCPTGMRMPTTAEWTTVEPCVAPGDFSRFNTMHDVAVSVGGCNCKWNTNWCFQPSIETIRQGRTCGDYDQLHICVNQ